MAGEVGSFLGGFSGSTIGSAVVKLFLDDNAYKAEMAKAQAQTGTAATGMSSSLGKFKQYGALAFAAVGTAAVVFAAKSVQAASAQEEALNKVNEIFDVSAQSVRAFADEAASSLGISETAALSAAGTFGNLFTNVGFADDAAADMSTTLVSLAADLASFNDLDPTIALEKLRAGLAGEAEPLRAVGVFLSEGKVQAEAYSSGLAEVGAELTDQQKIQARYNLILKETAQAQGDFERTSDSLANQQRTLTAQFEDLSASVGAVLVPITSDLLEVLTPLVSGLAEVVAKVQELREAGEEPDASLLDKFIDFATSSLPDQIKTAWNSTIFGADEAAAAAIRFDDAATGALESAGEAVIALGRQFSNSNRRIGVFAGMSGDAMKEWRDGVVEDIKSTFGTISELGNRFTLSAKDLEKGAEQSRRQTERFAEDLEELSNINISDAIKKALLDEGPAAVHAFVTANSEGKRNIVADLKDQQAAFKDVKDLIEEITGKVDDLGKKDAKASVTIDFKTSGVPLDVLKSLPGLDGAA